MADMSLPLSLEQMPISFTGQFLYKITSCDGLNPPNHNQEKASIYFAKPARAVARMIVALIVPIFVSFVGAFYHAFMTIKMKIVAHQYKDNPTTYSYYNHIAQSHGYAALIDATVFLSTISGALPCARGFSYICSKSSAYWTAKHFPDVKMNGEITYKEHTCKELLQRA